MSKNYFRLAVVTALLAAAGAASAQVTFYENDGYRGRVFSTDKNINNFDRFGFNDRASSVVVEQGRWEVCEDKRFEGRCVVLRRGSYQSLANLGLENRISSVRRVENGRRYDNEAPEPVMPEPYAWRRRANERIIEVPVTSVRAIVGPPTERCWMERQQVSQPSQPNVGGALVGGLLGGVLGHQVGGGTGKDIATVGGAVAGAAIGSNVGRNGASTYPTDVRRCENVASTTPAYWDVTYRFQGVDHRVQMATQPGQTIAVNGRGDPRE
jgi:uncharacterized protein YcfJ